MTTQVTTEDRSAFYGAADLASEVGVTKALVKEALKKLEADELVEKISGRPARYVAMGDEA